MKSFSKIVILATSLIFSNFVHSQERYIKTYGTIDDDVGYNISVCDDNGYIICGTTEDFYNSRLNHYFVRTDHSGNLIWTKSIDDQESTNFAYSVKPVGDSAFIAGGNSSLPFCKDDFAYIKLQANSELQWKKIHDYPNHEQYIHSVVVDDDTTYVFCGNSGYSNDWFENKIMLEKTNAAGQSVWMKFFHWECDDFFSHQMIKGINDGYVVCGERKDEPLLLKVSQTGNRVWRYTYDTIPDARSVRCLCNAHNQGYLMAGVIRNGSVYDNDLFFIKTDTSGQVEWVKVHDHETGYDLVSIDTTNDGGFLACVNYYDQTYKSGLIKLNSMGDTLWMREFSFTYQSEMNSMTAIPDGGAVMCGFTRDFGYGGKDVMVIRTDENGLVTSQIEKKAEVDIYIYPNPSPSTFHMMNLPEDCRIEIRNSNGRAIKNSGSIPVIDLTDYPSGLYYVSIDHPNGITIRKIIKN